MTQAEFGVAFLITLEIMVFAIIRVYRSRQERLKTARYKLFAVRDRIIRTVADGRVSQDDPVFEFLYEEINDIIPRAKPLSLRALVAALKKSRLLNDDTFREKCAETLSHSDPNLREAASVFFVTLIDILVMRSFMVRLSFRVTHSGIRIATWCREGLSLCRRVLSRLLPTQTEAYRLYKGLEEFGHTP
jgi:hypothetical protein